MSKSERQSTAQVLHNIADIVSHDVEQKIGKVNMGLISRVPGIVWRQLAVLVVVTVIVFIGSEVLESVRERIELENRPPAIDRIAIPYGVGAMSAPTLQEGFYAILENYNGFALEETPDLDALLERCLTSAIAPEQNALSIVPYNCGIRYTADYHEVHTYQNADGHQVNLLLLQFTPSEFLVEDAEGMSPSVALDARAKLTLRDIQDFARTIGRVNNFHLVPSHDVNYFYSSTRTRYSFTWSKDDWVFSITTDEPSALDSFMENFRFLGAS